MNHKALRPAEYLVLQEKGINIKTGDIDFNTISVSCENLSLYRKALRVKIRALLKLEDTIALKRYIRLLYTLGNFSSYLYGFHSCSSCVSSWQEELALDLQKEFDESRVQDYDGNTWFCYQSTKRHQASFAKAYEIFNIKQSMSECIQDEKPFLNLKDKAHFDKYLVLANIKKEKK